MIVKKLKELLENACKLYFRKKLLNKEFTVISNDCWGGEVYKLLNLPFNSPFIGCMIMAPCYLELLKDLKDNLKGNLTFIGKSKYPQVENLRSEKGYFPTGLLNNSIEIHFLHYNSESEVVNKWYRRVQRVNYSNLFVKFDGGKDYASEENIKTFKKLNFDQKLLILPGHLSGLSENTLFVQNYSLNGAILFYKSICHFDLLTWINFRKLINPNMFQKILIKIAFRGILKL